MYCKNCGYELNEKMTFCPGCGASLKKAGETAPAGGAAEDPSPDKAGGKGKEKGPLSRKSVLYSVIAALLILILIVSSLLLKKNTRDRLEEQLRLGAAFLEEMNFDMALDAYAAAIEIDEKEPRAYLGRADAYMGRAARKIEEAREEADFDSAREDLALAGQDIEKAEELISADDYAPDEEDLVTQEKIEEYKESRDRVQSEEEQKRTGSTFAGKIAEEVLGLPYIGNTSYNEITSGYIDEPDDLYDGRGYIAAEASDLDGDGEEEIFVVSLEGENTLGSGRNVLLFHVLEKENDSWHEQARLDSEQDSGHHLLYEIISNLEQDVFLRSEEDRTAVYTEICGYRGLGRETADWFFCKYTYDGTTLSASSIGSADPYKFYFLETPYNFRGDYHDEQGRQFYESFRSALDSLSEAGLPAPDVEGYFERRLLDSDESTRIMASFHRSLDYHSGDEVPEQTIVSLVDWTYAKRAGEDTAEEAAPPETYQLALYHRTFIRVEADFETRMDGSGYALYSYYDVDHDGIFELLINTYLSRLKDNIDRCEPSIYTMQGGTAVKIPLDYAISEGEYCELNVSKEGKTLLYTCKQRDLDPYGIEFYSDYNVYELTIENGRARADYLSSFTGSIDEAEPSMCLMWYEKNEKPDFRTCDLIWRFHSRLSTSYRLYSYTIKGNELSGELIMPIGDGIFYSGTVVIHMDQETADVTYNDDFNEVYGTEHLDLR